MDFYFHNLATKGNPTRFFSATNVASIYLQVTFINPVKHLTKHKCFSSLYPWWAAGKRVHFKAPV